MTKPRNLVLLSTVLLVVVWATAEMNIQAKLASPVAKGTIGPDVIVGDMPSVRYWGTTGGRSAYSVGTTSCNIGDEELTWIAPSNQHPVIGQNLYRVKDGRIEQLGQSWLKHGFFALSQNLCGSCQSTDGTALGIGCSDPYGASLNGQQDPFGSGNGGLGPRSEVNATTGFFVWPPRRLTEPEQGTLGGRISVLNSELDPAQNAGAQYFISSQYIHPEDADAGNDLNNSSYREVFVDENGGEYELDTQPSHPTVREESAINAWKAVHSDVDIYAVDIPDDGRVFVGVRTTVDGSGFHTEIALENLNSHQSVRSMDVDCCIGSVSAAGFRDVDYHAEPYDGTDWASSINGSSIEWSTDTFAQNQDANALRWGTMYSYWFDSDAEPATITLGLFRPGSVSEVTVELISVLPGDINLDGVVNLLDVNPFIDLLGSGEFQKEGDMNGDGVINLLDVDGFIAALAG